MSSCQNLLNSDACSISVSYLRPSSSDALLPWVISSLLLILHLPLVLVRVLHWEKGQVWSLAMAAFSIASTSLAYASTKLQADEILTWTPLTLVIDVGSVLQIFILLIEEDMVVADKSVLGRLIGWIQRQELTLKLLPAEEEDGHPLRRMNSDSTNEKVKDTCQNKILFVLCIVIFFALVTLQIVGLTYSIIGYSHQRNLQAAWCSPALQLGYQLVDVQCQTYNITISNSGTGCVNLPGNQSTWILRAMIILIVEIVLEIADAIILLNMNSERRLWKNIKGTRPWFTIVFGVGIWVAYIAMGVIQSREFPLPGNQVAIIGRAEGMCTSTLYDAGLRGSIIAWTDAFFMNLGNVYYGPSGP